MSPNEDNNGGHATDRIDCPLCGQILECDEGVYECHDCGAVVLAATANKTLSDESSLDDWRLEGIAHTHDLGGLPEHIRETTETDTWAVFARDGELRLVPRDEVEP